LADALGVASREIERLQEGECLVRATGTGVVKVMARKMPAAKAKMRGLVELFHRMKPPELFQRSQAAYHPLQELPPEYYRTLVDVIEQETRQDQAELQKSAVEADPDGAEGLGCWAEAACGLPLPTGLASRSPARGFFSLESLCLLRDDACEKP